MPTLESEKGFILICSDSGEIRQAVQNSYGFIKQPEVGINISELFDKECRNKLQLMLEQMKSQNSAFEWELVIPLIDGPVTVHCTAVNLENGFVFVGASSYYSSIKLMEEMLKLNNEQTNSLRLVMKELHQKTSEMNSRDNFVYEELTRLNSQLLMMQREIVKKNQQLEELNRQKNYFLAMAAHDLRSPLGTIASYCEVLLDDDEPVSAEENRDFISVIKKSSEFMITLISDLLDITKIESGNYDFYLSSFNLHKYITEWSIKSGNLAAAKDIKIKLNFNIDYQTVVVWDQIKIEQVLNNLLTNAVKFSNRNQLIEISIDEQIPYINIRFDDNGKGIPSELMDKLFLPFSRGGRIGTEGEKSTGLGLAICKKIAEKHGGKIYAQNRESGGASITVSLPKEVPNVKA